MKYFDLAWKCFQDELKENEGRATFGYGDDGFRIISFDAIGNQRVTQFPNA